MMDVWVWTSTMLLIYFYVDTGNNQKIEKRSQSLKYLKPGVLMQYFHILNEAEGKRS